MEETKKIEFACPACGKVTGFLLFGLQQGYVETSFNEQGDMNYDNENTVDWQDDVALMCDNCGATFSVQGTPDAEEIALGNTKLVPHEYIGEPKEKTKMEDIAKNEKAEALQQEFVGFVLDTLEELKLLFLEKNKQYKTAADPLANFRRGALLNMGACGYNEMYRTALGYENKHIVQVFNQSVYDDKVDESLRDIAIYSIIELFMIKKANEAK